MILPGNLGINSYISAKHFEMCRGKNTEEGSPLGLLCYVGSNTRLSFQESFKTNIWIKYPINKNLDTLQESTSLSSSNKTDLPMFNV